MEKVIAGIGSVEMTQDEIDKKNQDEQSDLKLSNVSRQLEEKINLLEERIIQLENKEL